MPEYLRTYPGAEELDKVSVSLLAAVTHVWQDGGCWVKAVFYSIAAILTDIMMIEIQATRSSGSFTGLDNHSN